MTEREREILFGAALLLVAALSFLTLELVVRHRSEPPAPPPEYSLDWPNLTRSVGIAEEMPGPVLYLPDARWRHISFNRYGFRGPDIAVPKPARTYRLAFIGDSIMFNAGYGEASTIAARTVAILDRESDTCDFDYVNFSGGSYRSEIVARRWPEVRDDIDPDLVIFSLSLQPYKGDGAPTGGASGAAPDLIGRLVRESLFLQSVMGRLRAVPGALAGLGLAGSGGADPAVARRQSLERLRDVFAGRDVLAMAYRTNVWAPPSTAEQQAAADLRDFAAAQGWGYADPFETLRPGKDVYHDYTHYGEVGLSIVSGHLAERIAETATLCFPSAPPKGAN